MRGPDIDFRQIRPHGQPASRANGFEELSSILIRNGVVLWPVGTRFSRFGNPDGGREGRGALPDGQVWAWQSKYLFEFDSSAAGQVSESVSRVLITEPALTRYFVALPMDLPAGDTATRSSAQTRWDDKVLEWEALAQQRGMSVEFVLVNAHELTSILTLAENDGRARYWFDVDVLSQPWQRRRVEEAVVRAGPRYSPELHVGLSVVRSLEGVSREAPYLERWRAVLAELRNSRRWGWRSPPELAAVFESALAECDAALTAADEGLGAMIIAAGSTIDLPDLSGCLSAGRAALRALDDLLREHCLRHDGYFIGEAATLATRCNNARAALWRADELARGMATQAAYAKRLVVTGRAGSGKTHLFCDVARRRLDDGSVTLLILGQSFDDGSLLPQLGETVQLDGAAEQVVAALDAAAEASGRLGLLMIDALNESERPERWCDDLRVLLSIVDQHEHVAVAVSCRSEFMDVVTGDVTLPTVDHPGFAEATDRAVARFTAQYGLEPPTFPVLNPEFSNPLVLKLTCEALSTLGAARFPLGSAGITTITRAFLEAVNRRLAHPSRCDYDESSDPVTTVVHELTQQGAGPYSRSAVRDVVAAVVPEDRGWSRSLLRGLLTECALVEIGHDRIAFGYQRLGDILRATDLASRGTDEVRRWFEGLGDRLRGERGLLGALAVVVPEQHGMEFFELVVDDDGGVPHEVAEAFLDSLLLRSAESIGARAVAVVRRLLDQDQSDPAMWDRLLRVACIPGHPLNAEWLHVYLKELALPERDATWSQWLVGGFDEEGETAVTRVLRWAWPDDLGARRELPDDVARTATLALGWMLSTTDRRVRDRATKALVAVAECGPVGFARGLEAFRGVDDPYVIERLAAAACGASLRVDEPVDLCHFADAVTALVDNERPEHLLTRDHVRHVIDSALPAGWTGSLSAPEPGIWPAPTRAREEIDILAGPPDHLYGSVWHSLTGLGDFGHYIVTPALRDLVVDDEQVLTDQVERAVFERVLELGWTPERFLHFDRSRHGGRDGVVERVGKKYQWVALHEILGRLSDRYLVKPRWSDEAPRPVEHAEQLVWRDIDPSVLARPPASPSAGGPPWYSPADPLFPEAVVDDYPADTAGIPDPSELFDITDGTGTQWLPLVSNCEWKQPLTVEVVALDVPRLVSWMQIHAYLVPTERVDALKAWANGKDWFGRWMPDVADLHNVLLGDHPCGFGWDAADGTAEWWRADEDELPCEFLQAALWYGGTGTHRDASQPTQTQGFIPTRPLLNALDLSKGRDFRWNDLSGTAVQDPSVSEGHAARALVMRRDLVPRLQAEGTALFWTVLAGYELHRPHHRPPAEDYRWITASASYVLDGSQVAKIDATAKRCRPGPETEQRLNWTTRISGS